VLAGDAWFADTALDFGNKDAAQNLPGKWIYEIGELQGFNRGDVTRIKAFISSQKDSFRPSYGRRTEDFPRGCVFVGTTNDEHYLTDTTGNRRYWPVSCGKVNIAALEHDRDQLWAEAVARYQAGERWWLEGAEEQLARAEQAEREAEDPWKAELEAFLTVTPLPAHGFAMGQLMGSAGSDSEDASPGIYIPVERRTAATTQRIGRIMKQLGYERITTRLPDGSTPKHYFPKK
jgi:putative DNA primase/helicase